MSILAPVRSLFLICCLGVMASAQGNVQLTIDTAVKYQTIDGFGASGAWWPTWVGDYPQEKQDRILDLLFTRRGIDLSIYRYNIPAGGGAEIAMPERVTATIETAPGKYDLTRDRKALEILSGVRRRGVQRYVLFANSPPPRLTRNGMTSGGEKGGSNLKPGEETAYANYLIDVATLVSRDYELPQVSISPINEPQWKWGENWRGQEGCHYTPAEGAAVIRKVIDVIDRRGVAMGIEAPESGAWKGAIDYADAMFADPVIDRRIHEVAIHSYWTDHAAREEAVKALRQKYPRKQLVVSEYCHMQQGHELGIDSALSMADVIHDDLTTGGAISWQWWLGVGAGGYQDALIYADPKTQKIELTKRLWVLGQYSRFIRPGFKRVSVKANDESLKASAFAAPDGGSLVCVVLNPTKLPATIRPALAGFASKRVSLHVTDESHDLTGAEAGAEIVLPARSVCTLVFER